MFTLVVMVRTNHFLFLLILFSISSGAAYAQEEIDTDPPRMALYVELVGKGFLSVNVDFRIKDKHRFSIGATSLDYEVVSKNYADEIEPHNWISPGVMYYFLPGEGAHRFELGAGFSCSPFLNRQYDSDFHSDSPISLHGVIGYRYQSKKKFFFRTGFTPFYRPKVWFLPLGGVSLGYSW